jgi:hypothetical protein
MKPPREGMECCHFIGSSQDELQRPPRMTGAVGADKSYNQATLKDLETLS